MSKQRATEDDDLAEDIMSDCVQRLMDAGEEGVSLPRILIGVGIDLIEAGCCLQHQREEFAELLAVIDAKIRVLDSGARLQ